MRRQLRTLTPQPIDTTPANGQAMHTASRVTTGFSGLDEILDDLRIGDNVVWKVNSIDDYRFFVEPFVRCALEQGRKVVYLRFGEHPRLLEDDPRVKTITLDPRLGFEPFASQIHAIATREGKETFYVFDCLSELLSAWVTDHMIGNFFRVTCPYLYELDTVAYFSLIRDRHSLRTISMIRETTQLLLDLNTIDKQLYIQPLKVWERYSPTMFLPHQMQEEHFRPVDNSFEATNLLAGLFRHDVASASRQLDHWHRLFLQAEELLNTPDSATEQKQMIRHLCRHMVGRDSRMIDLARRYFSLPDLLNIKARMIGTGFLGGKAVGMLLARNILLSALDFNWAEHLEAHDSFYVGSNVYYSYIVHNGLWRLFMRQKSEGCYFEAAGELRDKMLNGEFPDIIREGFQKMLEYYGQYPIIVRSSSLLEDGFGNAFAGKYDSFFCPNQGTPEQRCAMFEDAVRRIFASTMSEDALAYRLQRGLDKQDEQMGLLVQRVSGSYHKHYYFPELAGVGVSYNTFVWDKQMDPQAGMLRLVFGLGTRAVERTEGDYPRIVALDFPLKRPHKGFEDTRRFAQRDVDLVNVNSNLLETRSLYDLSEEGLDLRLERFAVHDLEAMQKLAERGQGSRPVWLLTFDKLLAETEFTSLMQRLLKTLEKAYNYPVDIEFTVNFAPQGQPHINIVQCRPLQTKGTRKQVAIPRDIPEEKTFFRSAGNFMGGNIALRLRWVIWVEPSTYATLSVSDRHEVARLIGGLNKRIADQERNPTLLLGPGRWGTSTPTLGVPISFNEINGIAALGEVAFSSGDLMPELSYGSHFFQDLVEAGIFYLALFPENRDCFLNHVWTTSMRNVLEGLMPSSSRFRHVVKVFSFPDRDLSLNADVVAQQLLCYRREK